MITTSELQPANDLPIPDVVREGTHLRDPADLTARISAAS